MYIFYATSGCPTLSPTNKDSGRGLMRRAVEYTLWGGESEHVALVKQGLLKQFGGR